MGFGIKSWFKEQLRSLRVARRCGRRFRDIRRLKANLAERMDANLPIFAPKRCEFHLARYRFAAKFADDKSLLDCACGTGYGPQMLGRQSKARSILGIDLCTDAISYASRYYANDTVSFRAHDACSLDLEAASFDLITSFETIEHVPDDRAPLNGFVRLLRPDGTLVISVPNNWPLDDTPFHLRVYDYDSFTSLLQEYFGEIEIHNQNSGCDHPFNHEQEAGIVPTTPDNAALAECFIAVCRGPRSTDS